MSRKNKLKRKAKLEAMFPIQSTETEPTKSQEGMTAVKTSQSVHQLGRQLVAPVPTSEILPPEVLKGLVAIATNAWRARGKMVDPTSGEPYQAMTRVFRDIERIYRNLEEIGLRIRDHTGDPYDDGQPMKVITSEPRPDVTRKYVLATLLPTIYWKDRIVQHGEIEIAVPPRIS